MTFVNELTPTVDGDNHRLAEFAVVVAPANCWILPPDVTGEAAAT